MHATSASGAETPEAIELEDGEWVGEGAVITEAIEEDGEDRGEIGGERITDDVDDVGDGRLSHTDTLDVGGAGDLTTLGGCGEKQERSISDNADSERVLKGLSCCICRSIKSFSCVRTT